MKKLTKTDEMKERLGIEMDHIKAQMLELRAKGRKLGLEARKDLDKQLLGLEKKQAELKVHMAEWAKAGEKATSDVKAGLERAAKELKKAVDAAASRLK